MSFDHRDKVLLLEVDLGLSNGRTTPDENLFDDLQSFEELNKQKFV